MNHLTRNLLVAAAVASVSLLSFETTEAGIFRKKGPIRSAVARFKERRTEFKQERSRRVLVSRTVPTRQLPAAVTRNERRRVFALFRRGDQSPPPARRQVRVYEPEAEIDRVALAASNRASNRVVVDISQQKAYLLTSSGQVAVESPVSTARPGKHTPRGTFYVTERVPVGKISTIYNVGMPYWMRLNSSVFGMHAGYLPGYPASAGCIRFPSKAAEVIFNHTTSGTRVSIYSSWNGS